MESIKETPWGGEKILAHEYNYVVKEIYVKPGHRLSKQYHKRKIETMILVSGRAILEIDGLSTEMKEMHPVLIKPGSVHRLSAGNWFGCTVVEVSSTELDDVVRLEDDYGRA